MLTVTQALELAVRHHRAGELEPAERIYRAVLRIDPQHAGVRYNLGNVLQKRSRFDEAIEHYRAAISLAPHDSTAHRVLGTAFKAQGNLGAAISSYRSAIALRPDYAEAHNNLGNAYLDLGDIDSAIRCFRSAVDCRSDSADFRFNLSNALQRADRLDDAEQAIRGALQFRPSDPDLHNSLGILQFDQGRVDSAIASYEAAISINPHHIRARYNRSLAWLLQGKWSQGWPEYEWRHRLHSTAAASFVRAWRGERRPDATLLIDTEQGLGDTIQFARFIAQARERIGRVIVRAPSTMRALLLRIDGVDEFSTEDATVPTHDYRIALLSLPGIFGVTPENVPRHPYLQAERGRTEFWRQTLAAVRGLRIGIQWQGNPNQPKDRYRSFPLREFAPLAETSGVNLISLQKGAGSEQLREATFKVSDIGSLLNETDSAFMETAAVISNLDLVITADTSIAHLAGALGVRTWIPVSAVPEWRWLLDREDTPWYRSARLFRQTTRGKWSDVFRRIREALQKELAGHAATAIEHATTTCEEDHRC
ncbi:MAG: tetratricopeptide repeat protein [Planctomycetaceae bacterium]